MENGAPTSNCHSHVVAFDFSARSLGACAEDDVQAAIQSGKFVWIDFDYDTVETGQAAIAKLGVVPAALFEKLFQGEPGSQVARFPDYIHLVLTACRLDGELLLLERVDVVIAEKYLLTLHRGPREFLEMVKRDYEADFLRFAQSPSFLIYEILDDLVDHYVTVQKRIEARVDRLQADLRNTNDDAVFDHVSAIGSDLLHFRSVLTPTRTVFTELATRRSLLISEATQGFIHNMVSTLERVLQDVMVDRDILAQSLNLHMSLLTHRTNQAMTKLTVISTIFLPLTFLCGVYGMNFDTLPELHWRLGYPFFWFISGLMVVGCVWAMRRARLF